MQKQIIYSKFISRLFSVTFDLLIISFLTSGIVKSLYNIMFYFTFKEQLDGIEGIEILNASYVAVSSKEFITFYHASPHAASKALILYMCTLLFMFFVMGIYFVFFWKKFGSTLGSMLMGIKVVDEKTLHNASKCQLIKRYLCYSISFIGIWWMFFNKKKMALHDKLSKTLVIKR